MASRWSWPKKPIVQRGGERGHDQRGGGVVSARAPSQPSTKTKATTRVV